MKSSFDTDELCKELGEDDIDNDHAPVGLWKNRFIVYLCNRYLRGSGPSQAAA